MTSNLGSHLIQDELLGLNDDNSDEIIGSLREKLFELLRQKIRPEILNRIDEVVMFKPLQGNELREIVDIQLNGISRMLKKNNEIILAVSNDAKDWLAKIGYDITFGARPLKRTIQNHITNILSQKILAGEILPGSKVEINVNDAGQFIFNIS